MWSGCTALLVASIALTACAGSAPPKSAEVASIAACEGSADEATCDTMPLCAFDQGDSCLMCRCIPSPEMASNQPNVGTIASVSGMSRSIPPP
jgi:hypothetical protein